VLRGLAPAVLVALAVLVVPVRWALPGTAPTPLPSTTVTTSAIPGAVFTEPLHHAGWIAALVVVGQALPLLARRRAPLAVLAVAAATAVVQALLLRPDAVSPLVLMAPVAALALHRPWRTSVPGAVATAVLLAAPPVLAPAPLVAVVGPVAVPMVIAWLAGAGTRRVRVLAAARRLRVRDEAAAAAVADERARIAGELHAVVAGRVAVVAVRAAAAQRSASTRPDQVDAALEDIQATAVEAVGAMRRLLGVLRADPDDAGGRGPQPGLQQLEQLVGEYRTAGLPVQVQVRGRAAPLPRELDLSAYRILQSALADALGRGGPVPTVASVEYGPDALTVRVRDRGPAVATAGDRHLVAIRERVAVLGGTVQAGPGPGGGWSVTASLPLTGAAA
jgi:signal transduction histidine kinase